MDERGTPHTRDNTEPVSDAQFTEGMIISIAVGTFYTINAFLPVLVWHRYRKAEINAMTGNKMYKFAWQILYSLHFLAFLPMALLWPLTYLGSAVIVDFYDSANWYVGSLAAGVIFGNVTLAFFLAALTYSETTVVTGGFIWLEALLYAVLEASSWYVSIWEYPKAHRQFYYSLRVEEPEDDEDQNEQQEGPSEDSALEQIDSVFEDESAGEDDLDGEDAGDGGLDFIEF
uniref:Uncharacterized protein n=1 Tax=Favella ehrenbergii TaxID=182087 RepID=A0A7S3I247_9SPIT|mmetsp:Transcript_28984/g.35925  ORF Transcript_28984/g.35925 Transcript_28984/m.35925 type:complete len:230 (+) Transcript_28984:14-703(+)|eukprot:CAMPEP_0170462230 /NCGR_PEP_ID=MMETSP0123-20130129/7813_1 /TAXON_ID=182087 /ORGANISM="Favella ehrenbergii, Strain Fehren 1" /LENGTH=229 /DNA_ID=CAMNT_0010727397 /DNA_START=12 /DNA_END=701 /DNA_ORIENTATION=+